MKKNIITHLVLDGSEARAPPRRGSSSLVSLARQADEMLLGVRGDLRRRAAVFLGFFRVFVAERRGKKEGEQTLCWRQNLPSLPPLYAPRSCSDSRDNPGFRYVFPSALAQSGQALQKREVLVRCPRRSERRRRRRRRGGGDGDASGCCRLHRLDQALRGLECRGHQVGGLQGSFAKISRIARAARVKKSRGAGGWKNGGEGREGKKKKNWS